MSPSPVNELTLLSFNIWKSGGQSLTNTIDVIRSSRADIVGLQECNVATARVISHELGLNWLDDGQDRVILSRYPLSRIGNTRDIWGGFGATLAISAAQRIHIFNTHLHYTNYGPYSLQDGQSQSAIIEQEYATRMAGLNEVLFMMMPYIAAREATFLVGDFNAPSHLDYADFPWPESLACSAAGLSDAYHVLHPGNRQYPGPFEFDEPGITWTPRTQEEPRRAFDRIDFIYYASPADIAPLTVHELDARNSVNPWPSDHRAVLGKFSLRPRA